MKKRKTAVMFTGILAALMCISVQAASVEELVPVVQGYLDDQGYNYSYNEDNESFSLGFSLDNSLSSTDVTIFLYDDMISVTADCPLKFTEEQFEALAVYTTLVNNDIYYGQFRLNRDYGTITSRSCNVIEEALPGKEEVDTLMYMAVDYMDRYGDDIASILVSGADPYELYGNISYE